jgi:hypothetical protein
MSLVRASARLNSRTPKIFPIQIPRSEPVRKKPRPQLAGAFEFGYAI